VINIISVVIPAYNEEKNIEKCLKSLNKQTISRQNFEIIVVDGHSTDKTVEIAKEFADKVIMQKTRWIAGARNDGAHAAKHDIIACTDADCAVNESWLEEIEKSLSKKDVVAVFGPVVPPENRETFYAIYFYVTNKGLSVLNKLNMHLAYASSFAFKKQQFLEIGAFSDISMLEDYELCTRIKKKGKVKYNKKMKVRYDTRRFNKYGLIRTVLMTQWNIMKIMFGFKPHENIEYAKQIYNDVQ